MTEFRRRPFEEWREWVHDSYYESGASMERLDPGEPERFCPRLWAPRCWGGCPIYSVCERKETKMQCCVCGVESDEVEVACSLTGPTSLAYCPQCMGSGIEPYGYLVASLVGMDSMDQVADWYLPSVYASLTHAGKTEDDLWADVSALEAELDKEGR